jgi:hypothetical protein
MNVLADIGEAFPVKWSSVEVTTLEQAEQDDRAYWRSKSPQERMAALEMLRRVAYSCGPTASGLRGPVEVVERPCG